MTSSSSNSPKKKAVILDRDGTIIVDKIYLNDPNEIQYLPQAIEGLQKMSSMGYVLLVATNQSGVARGLVSLENLHAIHEKMKKELAAKKINIAGFYYAPYSVESNHHLRKPNPGMLEAAAREHGIDLSQSWMVGDRASDIEAGLRAGTRSILIVSGNGETHPDAIAVCENLKLAADVIEKTEKI